MGHTRGPVSAPADYDFELPTEQIAQAPSAERSASRMLVLDPSGGSAGPVRHRRAADLVEELARRGRPLVVVNDSRVVPARVYLERVGDRRRFELLIVDPGPRAVGGQVRAWVRGAKKLRVDDRLALAEGALELRHRGRADDGRSCLFEVVAGELLEALDAAGELPLPPYVARPEGPSSADLERYQTLYARDRGSVAAPTAGLHFDADMLARIDPVRVTLHVGPGTFLPMDVDDVRDHRVGGERYELGPDAAARIEAARAEGRPIVAVGTTVTRTLESIAASHGGEIVADSGVTELVITPGHRFRVVDGLMTNFHLPRSSLLMLVCTFAGRERVLAAYREAVVAGYRFYSYGDCMLVWP